MKLTRITRDQYEYVTNRGAYYIVQNLSSLELIFAQIDRFSARVNALEELAELVSLDFHRAISRICQNDDNRNMQTLTEHIKELPANKRTFLAIFDLVKKILESEVGYEGGASHEGIIAIHYSCGFRRYSYHVCVIPTSPGSQEYFATFIVAGIDMLSLLSEMMRLKKAIGEVSLICELAGNEDGLFKFDLRGLFELLGKLFPSFRGLDSISRSHDFAKQLSRSTSQKVTSTFPTATSTIAFTIPEFSFLCIGIISVSGIFSFEINGEFYFYPIQNSSPRFCVSLSCMMLELEMLLPYMFNDTELSLVKQTLDDIGGDLQTLVVQSTS